MAANAAADTRLISANRRALMTTARATEQAVELVKTALASGLIAPATGDRWFVDPTKNGEELGKFVGAFVAKIAKEIDAL